MNSGTNSNSTSNGTMNNGSGTMNNGSTNGTMNNGTANGTMNNGSTNNGTWNGVSSTPSTSWSPERDPSWGWNNHGVWNGGSNTNTGANASMNASASGVNGSANMNGTGVNGNASMTTDGSMNSTGSYSAYGTAIPSLPANVQNRFSQDFPAGASTSYKWNQYGDWFHTYQMNNGRLIQYFYDQRGSGYSLALPVLQSYVPENIVNSALQKYGSSLYSISMVKTNGGNEAYQVGLLQRGQMQMQYLDENGATVSDVWRTEEVDSTMQSTQSNAAMNDGSMNSGTNNTQSSDMNTQSNNGTNSGMKQENADGSDMKMKSKDGKTKGKTGVNYNK
jgi:hypothetical protein